MQDDFQPIIHNLPGRSVKVYAVADVHIGSKECDLDGFRAFLDRLKREKDAYLVLAGDMLNNATKMSVSDVYEETLSPMQQIDACAELLEPVKDRILCMVMGNHEGRSKKDVDLDPFYDVAVKLGIQRLYRKNIAFVLLRMKNGSTRRSYSMCVLHGKSDAKRKKFEYIIEGVDAIITGHTHQGQVTKPAHIVFDTKGKAKVSVKDVVSIVATSWLDYGGYAARGMYLPSASSDPQYLMFKWCNTNDLTRPGTQKCVSVGW